MEGNRAAIDLDKTTVTLDPEVSTGGGLSLPGKDRVVFRPPTERKSLLGLDALARTKREESGGDGAFKVPRERGASIVSSLNEEEAVSEVNESEAGNELKENQRIVPSKRYRESVTSRTPETESTLTEERNADDSVQRHHLTNEYSQSPSSHSERSRSSAWHDSSNHGKSSSRFKDESVSSGREGNRRYHTDKEERGYRESSRGHERDYYGRYGRKRVRHDESRRTPGRSDWDEGRWEWEDTPRRDSHAGSSRCYQPSPKFVASSPDARLVSPWLGGQTPTGSSASPWDSVAPSPTPIHASGSSVLSANYRNSRRSKSTISSTNHSELVEDEPDDYNNLTEDNNPEISESMRDEMDYNADRAWYDREEGTTVFDNDSSSHFLGDEASFQKKEAERTKRLTRRDGSMMTLSQSKK